MIFKKSRSFCYRNLSNKGKSQYEVFISQLKKMSYSSKKLFIIKEQIKIDIEYKRDTVLRSYYSIFLTILFIPLLYTVLFNKLVDNITILFYAGLFTLVVPLFFMFIHFSISSRKKEINKTIIYYIECYLLSKRYIDKY